MIWLASLATSAYDSSKDVCRSILASKTASRAKHTAHLAVKNAIADEERLDSGAEARTSCDKVQQCKMQELHAAVIDHEASLAKRHSVVSLANDVKYWNVRRKRELLSACKKVVKKQKDAAEKSLVAWNQLKDGLLDPPDVFVTRKYIDSSHVNSLVAKMETHEYDEKEETFNPINEKNEAMDSKDTNEFSYNLYCCDYVPDDTSQSGKRNGNNVTSRMDFGHGHSSDEAEDKSIFDDALSSTKLSDIESTGHTTTEDCTSQNSDNDHHLGETESYRNNDNMTDSMQSLVDGLLTWGEGNWDTEDDFELPVPEGMAKRHDVEQIDEIALT